MPFDFGRHPQHVETLDWLFGRLPGKLAGYVIPSEICQPAGALVPSGNGHSLFGSAGLAEYAGPHEPPTLEGPADLDVAREWLRIERARLEEYTRGQFALIRQQHEAAMTKHFRQEEALTLHTQELNREMKFLASQTEALQQRARELDDWERALTQQTENLSHAQEELVRIQQTSENIQRDTEAQRAYLEELQAGTAQRQAAAVAARAEFDQVESALKQRQQAWEKKQEEIRAHQAAMEQRYQALEKAEEAVKRRMRELDELEDRLQQEFELNERHLARERREIAEMLLEVEAAKTRPARTPIDYVPRLMAMTAGVGD
jgi:chromosome segregation ATPase